MRVAATLLAPVLLIIAIAIRVTMGRPVLVRQVRPGYHSVAFTVLKFRTMPHLSGRRLAVPRESELPWLRRLLPTTGLDELPQLVAVLLGKMSLVVPRPLLIEYLDGYQPDHLRRHDRKPGITGQVQVNGRQSLKVSRRLEMDVRYVDHWSPSLDFSILFRTFLRLFRPDGISSEAAMAEVDDVGAQRRLTAASAGIRGSLK